VNFRLLGDCFHWVFFFFEITKVAYILGQTFSQKMLNIYIEKNGLGYTLGEIFTNPSGHPAAGKRHAARQCTAADAVHRGAQDFF
jgi:hypothetical protein